MFEHTDKIVIEHSRKMNEYYKSHPENTWKTNLSEEQIAELEAEGMGKSEEERKKTAV